MRPALANIITARVPEADLLIDTMTVRPQGNRAFLISDTIRRLKAADIWAKLDVLWMIAAHDAQAARVNWKNPASFALTAVNSPTFTADRGYAGNGSTSYLDTGWDAANNGVQISQNSAAIFGWNRTSRAAAAMSLMGAFNGPFNSGSSIENRFTSDQAYGRCNDSPLTSFFTNTESSGFFHADRQSSTARTFYRNSAPLGSYGSSASGALVSNDVQLLCAFGGSRVNFSSDQIAIAGLGASLNASAGALFSIMQTYMNGVGA